MATRTIEAIVIGGSAGALDALEAILPALPATFSIPIAVVLHLRPGTPSQLADVLAGICRLPVREPDDKEPISPGTVYVAPPDYHLLVEKERTFSLSVDAPVRFSRPAIDVLFESAADAYGPALAGVLLAGASDDGARGLVRIKQTGGTTIVQSPETAGSRTMPEAALRLGPADRVLPASEIALFLTQLRAARTS